jgi:hypothetical protein
MSDIDLVLRDELHAVVPEPRREPDWMDVLQRAQLSLWRRPVVLAVAAALLVLGTAAGVTAALGGFDAWLSGKPGKPAPKSEQQRFEAANGRSWAAFPKDTKLRELIRTNVGGKTYVLYGFRSGNSICLRLKAISLGHSVQPMCAPASTLAHISAPILVVDANDGFADRHNHPTAQLSFGIAADGVKRVDVHAVDGTHRAAVGGNAYLWVENEPSTGNRALSISATTADGRRTTISLDKQFGFPTAAPSGRRPPGPTHVEARIRHPKIGWYLRGEARGHPVRGLRMVKPDPLSDVAVGLSGRYCLVTAIGTPTATGTSCSSGNWFFARGPLNVGIQGTRGQFMAVTGAAADGVARVRLFLADGERQAVPLKDNLFAALVGQTSFPARVVGYDARGRVVGIETTPMLFGGRPVAATRHLRAVLRVRGPEGASAVLRIGPVVDHVRCWRVDFSTGQSPSGCKGTIPTGPWVFADLVQPAGKDVFVIGETRAPVVRVQLRFEDGTTIATRPVAGLFVMAIPRAHLSTQRQFAFALGLERNGHIKQRQGVLFRANS